MKLLWRNATDFEYLPYTGNDTDLNTDNQHTGEYQPQYGTAVTYRGNISIPGGQTSRTFYGLDTRYTHTLVMDNPDADIHEGGVVRWHGDLYDVLAVRPSLNALSAALVKQTVNHAPVQTVSPPTGQTGSEDP